MTSAFDYIPLLSHWGEYLVICTIDYTMKLEGFSPLTLLLISVLCEVDHRFYLEL